MTNSYMKVIINYIVIIFYNNYIKYNILLSKKKKINITIKSKSIINIYIT
jgi:hypothetical protein